MKTILLSLAMLATVATAANADINVWWQLDGSNCDAALLSQGEGRTLHADIPVCALAGFYELELSMWISTDGAASTNGCVSYRNNLWRGTDATLTMEGDPVAGNLNPLNWTGPAGYDAGSINNGDSLIMDWGRGRAAGQPAIWTDNSPLKVIEMRLRLNEPSVQFGPVTSVWQSVGANRFVWVPLPATLNKVFFGPNPWVYGNAAVDTFAEASDTELPVIWITSIPEPTPLALLGLGLVMLSRRR